MAEIDLIGVPLDGYGRPGNQARAASALRDAGLLDAFEHHHVACHGDLDRGGAAQIVAFVRNVVARPTISR